MHRTYHFLKSANLFPPIPIATNAEQNLSDVETWAQNLPSPQTFPQLNQAQTFPYVHYASGQLPRLNFPLPNQQLTPFIHSANFSTLLLVFHSRTCIHSKWHFQQA